MWQRLTMPALGCLLLFGYFWSGAVAKLWLMTARPDMGGTLAEPQMRLPRGQFRPGINMGFGQLMSLYGPLPMARLLGPGAAAFLEGLGVGLDPLDEQYDRRRERALTRAVRVRFLNP